jgi:uncharacterized protein (UPF0248 family)
MQPLDQLLDRITWDAGFGSGRFALGYIDRLAGGEVVVSFDEVHRDPGGRTLALLDDDGLRIHVPLHRVRTVYKDGVPVWQRPSHAPGKQAMAGRP